MAKLTSEEVRKRKERIAAANPNRSYARSLGSSLLKSAAGIGREMAGSTAGLLNNVQGAFTGVSSPTLEKVMAFGDIANDPVYQDFLAAGRPDLADAYVVTRTTGGVPADLLLPGAGLKSVKALKGLRLLTKGGRAAAKADKAAKAAKLAKAKAKMGKPGKLKAFAKKHPVAIPLVGAGAAALGGLGVAGKLQLDKEALPGGVTKAEGPNPAGGPSGGPQPKRQMSPGSRTFEDYVQAALRKAGYGSSEAEKYYYDPFHQTGGTAPAWAALTGNNPALNPYIAGGRAPTFQDAQRMYSSNPRERREYADSLDAVNRRAWKHAYDAGVAGDVAAQQGEGLQFGMQQKAELADKRNQALTEKALYQGQLRTAEKLAETTLPADVKKAAEIRDQASRRFEAYLDGNPEVERSGVLQEVYNEPV